MLNVSIKHVGTVHKDLPLDTTKPGSAFKQTVYERTGIPVDRMKVMVKGGVLKDDSDWAKIAPKDGHTFVVVGTAGELPKPPAEPVVFMEDMDEKDLADALHMPVGLTNLGNTCYMNSTVQVLKAIPELQTALKSYTAPTPSTSLGTSLSSNVNAALTTALGSTFTGMSQTTEPFAPLRFLQVLRQANPQFGEVTRPNPAGMGGGGYAQQDADECWSQIITSLSNGGLSAGGDAGGWTDKYMAAEMETTLKCIAAPDEPPTTSKDRIFKLQCNISNSTNYMHTGIKESLDQEITKKSPTLDQDAPYQQTSRLSRIPQNLTVQMVRFYWKRDIAKKSKIMRKVKFPFELDLLADGIVTDELKAKLAPVNGRLREIERDRMERRKVRKRTRIAKEASEKGKEKEADGDVVMGDHAAGSSSEAPAPSEGGEAKKEILPGELEEESVIRKREAEELLALVHPDLKNDVGANVSGMYELIALVTHKGASADSGHYIGWVKAENSDEKSDKEEWYKFDDDKVSLVDQDKISSLDGGGQDSTAYILLYRCETLILETYVKTANGFCFHPQCGYHLRWEFIGTFSTLRECRSKKLD
ncbi:deubiquitinating enzyme [Tulasnella sp. 419]|nr:deubiquitinating enzyme [Tulasnella sp. 419]